MVGHDIVRIVPHHEVIWVVRGRADELTDEAARRRRRPGMRRLDDCRPVHVEIGEHRCRLRVGDAEGAVEVGGVDHITGAEPLQDETWREALQRVVRLVAPEWWVAWAWVEPVDAQQPALGPHGARAHA